MAERAAVVVVALALVATAARADEPAAVAGRVLAAREEALGRQHDAARAIARKQAWMTYRLARRRALGFFGAPERRRADATSVDLAAVALRRSLEEATLLANELAVVREERAALEPREGDAAGDAALALAWPVRPNVVGVPGRKREPVTGVELDGGALEILARLDEPAGAPAPGEVRRVERLAEGGWAIALAHEGGLVTVLAGLRAPTVAAGDRVERGATLGLVGRTLDGAPVLTLAAFRRGQAVDPRGLLPAAGPGRAALRRRVPARDAR